jgi:hypothetical protein
MMYKPKYKVIAGGYVGEFDLPIETLIRFLRKFRPDPVYHATTVEVYRIETGEKVAVLEPGQEP